MSPRRKRAITLLETMVASTLLLLLTTALFASWNLAAQSWQGMLRSTTRLTGLEVALKKIQLQLQDASLQAVYQNAPAIPALAYSSAWGLAGSSNSTTYCQQPSALAPLWQKYGLYYLDTNVYTLDHLEIPIPAGDPASLLAVGLDQWNGPSGIQPLAFYCSGGAVVLSAIDTFAIQRSSGLITVTISSPPTAVSGSGTGRLTLSQSIWLHNP